MIHILYSAGSPRDIRRRSATRASRSSLFGSREYENVTSCPQRAQCRPIALPIRPEPRIPIFNLRLSLSVPACGDRAYFLRLSNTSFATGSAEKTLGQPA